MKKRKHSIVVKIILLILILIISTVIVIGFRGYNMYKVAIGNTSIEKRVNEIISKEDYVSYDNIPKDFVNAVVAVEDHRFYSHGAIDIIAIGRAVVTNIQNFKLVEGGSTITQQVAKNMYFTQEKKFERKIAEVFVAIDLEKKYSKDQILAMYINEAYYGDGYYGILDASKGYFKKEPDSLTLFELTLLAGVPNAPGVYSPTSNIDLAIQRQNQVIAAMVENNFLTNEQIKNIQTTQKKIVEKNNN